MTRTIFVVLMAGLTGCGVFKSKKEEKKSNQESSDAAADTGSAFEDLILIGFTSLDTKEKETCSTVVGDKTIEIEMLVKFSFSYDVNATKLVAGDTCRSGITIDLNDEKVAELDSRAADLRLIELEGDSSDCKFAEKFPDSWGMQSSTEQKATTYHAQPFGCGKITYVEDRGELVDYVKKLLD